MACWNRQRCSFRTSNYSRRIHVCRRNRKKTSEVRKRAALCANQNTHGKYEHTNTHRQLGFGRWRTHTTRAHVTSSSPSLPSKFDEQSETYIGWKKKNANSNTKSWLSEIKTTKTKKRYKSESNKISTVFWLYSYCYRAQHVHKLKLIRITRLRYQQCGLQEFAELPENRWRIRPPHNPKNIVVDAGSQPNIVLYAVTATHIYDSPQIAHRYWHPFSMS